MRADVEIFYKSGGICNILLLSHFQTRWIVQTIRLQTNHISPLSFAITYCNQLSLSLQNGAPFHIFTFPDFGMLTFL